MKPVRIAVIGAGSWGRNHVRTVVAMPNASLAAICDIDAERRNQLCRQYPGTLVTDDVQEAMSSADGVVVATPVLTHADLARAAVERGLPVLIEKPMTLAVSEAEDLVTLSTEAGVPIVVGHLLVYHPAVQYLQEMIAAGELGTIHYLYSQRVNLGQVRPDENALWSFGPHDVSVALYLLGEAPVRLAAHGRSFLQRDIEDVVFLTMYMPSGVMVHVQMSWLDPHKERRLTVVGSDKMAVFDDMETREKIKIYDKGVGGVREYGSFGESLAVRDGDIWIPRLPNAEPLRQELEHFADVVRGDAAPRSDAREGLAVVRILEAASVSLREGGRVVDLGSNGAAS